MEKRSVKTEEEEREFATNTADSAHLEEQEQEAKLRRENELHDLRYVLRDTRGRRFLWRLIGLCGPMRSPFSSDNALENYLIGQAEIGRVIIEDSMEADLNKYLKMYKEGNKADA